MSDAANKGQWLRGASVSGLDYTDLLTKILRSASAPEVVNPDSISHNANAAVLMATQVNRAKLLAALEDETTTQSADRTIPTTKEQSTTTTSTSASRKSEPSPPPSPENELAVDREIKEPPTEMAHSSTEKASSSSTTSVTVLTTKFPFTTADLYSTSSEQDYNTKLPDEPDIVKAPNSNMPPKSSHPLASVLSDEAIERFKKDALWSNFLDIYPRKNTEPTELELSRLDSSSRLKPMAIDGVPRHSPYAFYSSFSETVPTLHQSMLNNGNNLAPPPSMLGSEIMFWWQSPYLIYGLVILFSAVLLMSMTLQCCVIYSQRRQIEYLRDESVRSRTCASIPSYLMRVPANTEVMHPRISDGVVPSATTNIGSRTLDELVDEVERRITKQLIKYNQRTLPPDVRSSSGERTPERRISSARNNSVRPPRARPLNSGGSSSTSFSPQSVVRVDQHPSLNSSRSLEDPTEMLSVAIGTSPSPSTPSTVNNHHPGRKAPRIKASSRMS